MRNSFELQSDSNCGLTPCLAPFPALCAVTLVQGYGHFPIKHLEWRRD
ncbi:hypothetical protein BH20ACT14_BH20ACT14_10350 [soil metagenome]